MKSRDIYDLQSILKDNENECMVDKKDLLLWNSACMIKAMMKEQSKATKI